jgi:glucose uptake protein GlcU
LFGAAAGVGYALQAAVTKVFVGELGHGVPHLLATWSTYALLVSAIVGFVLQQSALKTGALAPAMAASNASTLVSSALFAFVVFDERLTGGGGRAAIACAGLALAVVGVIRLAAAESGGEDVRGRLSSSPQR